MRHVISILMLLCAGLRLASGELNECTTTEEMIQCETSKGFTYHVPHNMTVYLRDCHCEHGWYHMNGTLIADSTIEDHENLTLSTCSSLQWQLRCDNIQDCWIINYTVKYQATHLPGNDSFTEDKENANSPSWLIAVIVGSVMAVTILPVTIWLFWKKCVKHTPPGEGGSEII